MPHLTRLVPAHFPTRPFGPLSPRPSGAVRPRGAAVGAPYRPPAATATRLAGDLGTKVLGVQPPGNKEHEVKILES